MVAKNTLVNLAIAGTEYEGLGKLLKGMNGIVISGECGYSSENPKKALKDFKKKDTFVLKVVSLMAMSSTRTTLLKLHLCQPKELLTMLLRTVQEGPRQAIGVIQAPARDLVNLIKNYETNCPRLGNKPLGSETQSPTYLLSHRRKQCLLVKNRLSITSKILN